MGIVRKRRVSELMNPDVVCARPDMTVGELRRLMTTRGVSATPVVGKRGEVLGIVTQHDLLRHASQRITVAEAGAFVTDDDDYREIGGLPADLSRTLVEKVMRRPVYGVAKSASVAVAANIMRERAVHRLVVTEQGSLVGIISAFDLLRVVEEAC